MRSQCATPRLIQQQKFCRAILFLTIMGVGMIITLSACTSEYPKYTRSVSDLELTLIAVQLTKNAALSSPDTQTPTPEILPPTPDTPSPTTDNPGTTEEVTPTPDYAQDLDGAEVINTGHLDGQRIMVALSTDKSIQYEYRGKVDNKELECMKIEDYPNRLYCIGAYLKTGHYTLEIYAKDEDVRILEKEFYVPPEPTANPKTGNGGTGPTDGEGTKPPTNTPYP